MKKELVWNAFYCDFNGQGFEIENVIRDDLIDDIKKAKKKDKIHTMEDLKEIIRRNLMWHYWSKVEWEYVITPIFRGEQEKHDVWFQVEMNLDRLTEYIAREMKIFKDDGNEQTRETKTRKARG